MLQDILDKCLKDEELSDDEISFLLSRKDPFDTGEIFAAARQVRNRYFKNKVFMYGFVYFSTYCQNNCTFCYYRKDHTELQRYRKTIDDIAQISRSLKASGVHLIDLTTGDDPWYTQDPERLAEIVKTVKDETGLGVMVSPGLLSRDGIDKIKEAGADWYALYQETHNTALYEKLRKGQSYKTRMDSKLYAKSRGLLIEEGLLTGVGDSQADKIASFHEIKKMQPAQVRAMTFIPQKGAPLESADPGNFLPELMLIAVMRLVFKDVLIPASLDVEGLKGLKDRLEAGANVVTSIIPPQRGYAGVANSVRDIDEGFRTVEGIADTLNECGLKAVQEGEYLDWIDGRRQRS